MALKEEGKNSCLSSHRKKPLFFSETSDLEDRLRELEEENRRLREEKEELADNIRKQRVFYEKQQRRLIRQLSGGIAHHFNNYLGVIRGYVELLEMDCREMPSGSNRGMNLERFEMIQDAIDRSSYLISRILSCLSFDDVKEPRVEVHHLLSQIKEYVVSQECFRSKGIKVSLSLNTDLDVVKAGSLREAFVNILENACEAITSNDGFIRISTETIRLSEDMVVRDFWELSPGMYLVVKIEDSGRGVAEEDLGKIFEPFFSTKQDALTQGRGLGLVIVEAIIQTCGGAIRFESLEESGSLCRVYLPIS